MKNRRTCEADADGGERAASDALPGVRQIARVVRPGEDPGARGEEDGEHFRKRDVRVREQRVHVLAPLPAEVGEEESEGGMLPAVDAAAERRPDQEREERNHDRGHEHDKHDEVRFQEAARADHRNDEQHKERDARDREGEPTVVKDP